MYAGNVYGSHACTGMVDSVDRMNIAVSRVVSILCFSFIGDYEWIL